LSDEVTVEQRINLPLTGKILLMLDSQLKLAFRIRPMRSSMKTEAPFLALYWNSFQTNDKFSRIVTYLHIFSAQNKEQIALTHLL